MRPQGIEQRVALRHFKTEHVGVWTTPEKECLASGRRLGSDQRMVSPHRFANIRDGLVSLTEHSSAVGGRVMYRDLVLRSLFQLRGHRFVSREHIGKISV